MTSLDFCLAVDIDRVLKHTIMRIKGADGHEYDVASSGVGGM